MAEWWNLNLPMLTCPDEPSGLKTDVVQRLHPSLKTQPCLEFATQTQPDFV